MIPFQKYGYAMLVCLVCLGFLPPQSHSGEDGFSRESIEFFELKIRPLLANNCYECHGEKKQKANLVLIGRDAILKGGESGPAAIPGNPDKSLLIRAVRYVDSNLEMPPKKKLSTKEVQLLENWVSLGLPWPNEPEIAINREQGHQFSIKDKDRNYWAFRQIEKPDLSGIESSGYASPIDFLVSKKLNALGIEKNDLANDRTLIRRAWFDLIGLPPSFQDVHDYVNDHDPGKWSRLVESLLSRSGYGERWGRHWLDVVRYAQSNGYERDDEKPLAWKYRDYVINAFNQDKPYDQFVLEQLAGDEISGVTPDSLTATGFYRLGVWDDEPDDARAAEFDGLDDMLKTTSETFLGVTMGCARCHDHMYDPFSQKDYYEMLSYFRNVKYYSRPEYSWKSSIYHPLVAPSEVAARHTKALSRADALIDDASHQLSRMDEPGAVSAIFASPVIASGGTRNDALMKQTWESADPLRTAGEFSSRYREWKTAHRFDADQIVKEAKWKPALDGGSTGFAAFSLITGNKTTVTLTSAGPAAIDLKLNGHPVSPTSNEGNSTAQFELNLNKGRNDIFLGIAAENTNPELRFQFAGKGEGLATKDVPESLKKIFDAVHYAFDFKFDKNGYALAVREVGPDPRETRFLVRGDAGTPREKVEPAFPEVFSKVAINTSNATSSNPYTTGRRLKLANWISSANNPLTARVMVNRIWQNHFGKGIVKTPNDFGSAGAGCSNPELLDWLAAEFIESGWSVKHMHRIIMASETYRRSSSQLTSNADADPGNDYFWRQNLRRLDAEAIRDSILKVSGVLNNQPGGRGFFPDMSAEVIAGGSRPGRGWSYSPPEQQNRRSVYSYVKRTMMVPFLEIFDYSGTEGSIGARSVTTVAPQALTLLNSEFTHRLTTTMAQSILESGDRNRRQWVTELFKKSLQRPPSPEEFEFSLNYLKSQEQSHRSIANQIVIFSDVPAAMERGFMNSLPAERFQFPPSEAWSAHRGQWGNVYEGIINLDTEKSPFLLHKNAKAENGKLSAEFLPDQSVTHAGFLFGSRAVKENHAGYELLLDIARARVALRKHLEDGTIQMLAQSPVKPLMDWTSVNITFNDGALMARIENRHQILELTAHDASPISSASQVGLKSWGGKLAVRNLTLHQDSQSLPLFPNPKDNSRIAFLALRDLTSVLFNLNEFVYFD